MSTVSELLVFAHLWLSLDKFTSASLVLGEPNNNYFWLAYFLLIVFKIPYFIHLNSQYGRVAENLHIFQKVEEEEGEWRTREMWIKYLAHEHEDLSSDP